MLDDYNFLHLTLLLHIFVFIEIGEQQLFPVKK